MDLRSKLRRAAKRYETARTDRDETIRQAAAAGMTRRAIAQEVGISYGRVQQIVKQGAVSGD